MSTTTFSPLAIVAHNIITLKLPGISCGLNNFILISLPHTNNFIHNILDEVSSTYNLPKLSAEDYTPAADIIHDLLFPLLYAYAYHNRTTLDRQLNIQHTYKLSLARLHLAIKGGLLDFPDSYPFPHLKSQLNTIQELEIANLDSAIKQHSRILPADLTKELINPSEFHALQRGAVLAF